MICEQNRKVKIIFLLIMLIIFSASLSFFVSNLYNTLKYNKEFNENIESYFDGVKDGIITDLGGYILECRPDNPEMFAWFGGAESDIMMGVIIKCGNTTYPLKYSDEHFKRLK